LNRCERHTRLRS